MPKYIFSTFVCLICFVSLSFADDLSPLSDEFENAATLPSWTRLFEVEGWGADQLQSIDVGETRESYLTMIPKTSTWDMDWKGALLFKQVTGDFIATMEIEPRNRNLDAAPGSSYSLAGMMVRTPRDDVTQPSDWRVRGENHIFLSLGTGNNPGNYQFEVKSTINSTSSVEVDSGAPRGIVQIVRIGDIFLVLRKLDGGDWEVHRRYSRSDMPDTLQVGMIAYTDAEPVSLMSAFDHNRTSIDGNSPDLNAAIDYFRFRRPRVPSSLSGADFSDSHSVSDSQVVELFGGRVNKDPAASPRYDLEIEEKVHRPGVGIQVGVVTVPGVFYRLEKSVDMRAWTFVEVAEAVTDRLSFLLPVESDASALFLRVAED